MASPEKPFFADRRKRSGLIRRVGNLAEKLTGSDPELLAMHIIEQDQSTPEATAAHLRAMMASQLEFVSPYPIANARLIAEHAGVLIEFINLRTYPGDISQAPEVMRAAFSDVARLAGRNLE